MAIVRPPDGKTKTLAPSHPNVGTEVLYRQKLERLIDEMNRSILYWVRAAYRANTPEIAQDRSPAMALRAMLKRLARQWLKRFDEAAPELADWFAKSAADRTDASLKATLRKAGMTVRFKMTAAQNDAVQATIGENISLIRSIASEQMTDLEGAAMRSVAAGRDLGSLTKVLEERFGMTRRRAAFIARDQNNKATATITRVRQQELGITEAIWVHSRGGKHPRQSHVEASTRKLRYKVSEGAYIDGAWIRPGELPNCRCVSRSVIPGFS